MCYESTPYYTITPESMRRERERLYSKARHDEAQALHHAREEARAEGRAEGKAEARAEGKAEARAEGKAEARAEGKAEARAEGKAEGRAERDREIVRNMFNEGISVEMIARCTGLTPKEIESLR